MFISVRYLGIVVHSSQLDSTKEYRLGRAKDNDIVVDVSMMSRHQGKIFFEDGQWFFAPSVKGKYPGKVPLRANHPIDMRDQLEILISDAAVEENTKGTSIDKINAVLNRSNRKINRVAFGFASAAMATVLMVAGGYKYWQMNQPMNAKTLLPFVRSKIVEFELPEKSKMVDDLRKYAKFEDKDFSDFLGFCTGFLVAKNIVLTANHCLQGSGIVEPSHRIVLKTHDKKSHKIKRILGFNTKRDFAFIEVEGMESYGHLDFASEYALGDKVFTVGNAHGQGVAIREGILANETPDRNDPSVKYIRYSAAASPGNSGGPLVDAYGKIVSLVFAKVNAGENYNLGTKTSDLVDGFGKFVKNQDPKKVNVSAQEMLVVYPQGILATLNLPAQDSWYDNPEYMEPLKKLSFEMDVPATPEKFFDQSIVEANKSARKVFDSILVKMAEDKQATSTWESWAKEGAKVLIPSQFSPGYRKTDFNSDMSQVLQSSGFMQPPSAWGRERFVEGLKKGTYNFSAQEIFGQMVKLSAKEKQKIKSNMDSGDFYFSLGNRKEKSSLMSYAYRPGFESTKYFKNDVSDWENKRVFSKELFLESLVGQKGTLASSRSTYVRPNSFKDFTVKKLDEKVEEMSIEDRLGRTWNIKSLTVFDTKIESYCLPMMQGAACFVKAIKNDLPQLVQTARQNFADYSLSKYLARPEFATVDATLDYFRQGYAKTNPIVRDFTLSPQKNGDLKVTLNTIGAEFTVPKKMKTTSIRLNGGYLTAEKKWVALGFEIVNPMPKKNAAICGMGATLKGSPSQAVLAAEDATVESYKKYKMNKKARYYAKDFKSKKLGKDFRAYGYCWKTSNVEEDKETGARSSYLDKMSAMKVNFKVLGPANLAH